MGILKKSEWDVVKKTLKECIVKICVENKDGKCINPSRITSENGCAQTKLLGQDPKTFRKWMEREVSI